MFMFDRITILRLFFNYNFTDFNHIFNHKFESELILAYSNLVEKDKSKMIPLEYLKQIKEEVIKLYKSIFVKFSSDLISENKLFEIYSDLHNWIYSNIYDCFIKHNIYYFDFDNSNNNLCVNINNLNNSHVIENTYGKNVVFLNEIINEISKMIIKYFWEVDDIFNYLTSIINSSNEDLIKISKEINDVISDYSHTCKDIEKEIIELSIYYLQRFYIQNQLIKLNEDNKNKDKSILKKKLMRVNFNIENLIKKIFIIYYEDFDKLMKLFKSNKKKKSKKEDFNNNKNKKENDDNEKIKLTELFKNNIKKKKRKEK